MLRAERLQPEVVAHEGHRRLEVGRNERRHGHEPDATAARDHCPPGARQVPPLRGHPNQLRPGTNNGGRDPAISDGPTILRLSLLSDGELRPYTFSAGARCETFGAASTGAPGPLRSPIQLTPENGDLDLPVVIRCGRPGRGVGRGHGWSNSPGLALVVCHADFVESPEHEENAVRVYVAGQFELLDDPSAITHAEKVASESVRGQTYDVWDVHTSDLGRWWVLTCPMNYYPQDDFKSVDVVLSFHIGLTTRVTARSEPSARSHEVDRLTETWRRWQQAADELDDAKEVEDFQAVGMRLRETLVTFVGDLASDELVPEGEDMPKRADVTRWSALIAGAIAAGDRGRYLRSYLKSISVDVWQYVNWVTHARSATLVDAGLGVEMVEHMLSMFVAALLRTELGEPAKCPSCGSHRTRHRPSALLLGARLLRGAVPVMRLARRAPVRLRRRGARATCSAGG